MAYNLFKLIYVDKAEREGLNSKELILLLFHELSHSKQKTLSFKALTRRGRQTLELEATINSFLFMKELGYNNKQILRLEFNLLLFKKYGVKLKELKEMIKENG